MGFLPCFSPFLVQKFDIFRVSRPLAAKKKVIFLKNFSGPPALKFLGGVKINFLLHFYYQIFSSRGGNPLTPLNRPMIVIRIKMVTKVKI